MDEQGVEALLAGHTMVGKSIPAAADHNCRFVGRIGECDCQAIIIGCTGCEWTTEPDGTQGDAHRAHVASLIVEHTAAAVERGWLEGFEAGHLAPGSKWQTTKADEIAAAVDAALAPHVDESGLPRHLPMGVTEDGHGPEDDSTAHHFVCWCNDPECSWTKALSSERSAALAQQRDRLAEAIEGMQRTRHNSWWYDAKTGAAQIVREFREGR